ncbi:MAG: N-acetylmuramoyl-L-alanine amidase, partial [Candidatus Norongarragalinales archaeon]
ESSKLLFQEDETPRLGERIVLSEEVAPNAQLVELRISGWGVLRTYAQAEVSVKGGANKFALKPIRLLTKPNLDGNEKKRFVIFADKLNALGLNLEQSAALEKKLNEAYVEKRRRGSEERKTLAETLAEWFEYADALADSIAANGFEKALSATVTPTVFVETPLNAGEYKATARDITISGSTEFTITEITPTDTRLLSIASASDADAQSIRGFLYSFEGENARAFSAVKIQRVQFGSETTSESSGEAASNAREARQELLLVTADYSRFTLFNGFFPFENASVTLKLWFPKRLEYKTVKLETRVTHEKLRDPTNAWLELDEAQAKKTRYPQVFGEPSNWSETRGLEGKRVFIDPGHGSAAELGARYGDSPGRYGYGAGALFKGKRVWECDLNLAVARKLKTLLEENGAIVAMSRNENVDGFLNLTARAAIANAWRADVVVSVHHDHAGATQPLEYYPELNVYGGRGVYCDARCEESKKLAVAIDKEIKKLSLLAGASRGPFPDYERGFRLGLLHRTNAPTVLVEVTGMGNVNAFTPAFQEKAAQAIFAGIKKFFEERPAAAHSIKPTPTR